jgi:anaerobic ribonucleoside-triphosphate reductase
MKSKSQFLNEHKNDRQKTQVWTRVMGYMRNVSSFNSGKQSEFKERIFYDVKSLFRNRTENEQ